MDDLRLHLFVESDELVDVRVAKRVLTLAILEYFFAFQNRCTFFEICEVGVDSVNIGDRAGAVIFKRYGNNCRPVNNRLKYSK